MRSDELEDRARKAADIGSVAAWPIRVRPRSAAHSEDGMSIAANGGKKYRFSFRLTFAAVGGFNG